MNELNIKEDILLMSQEKVVHIDFEYFSVTLGDNGLYYLDLNVEDKEIECLKGCINEEECDCARMYPNSMVFKNSLAVIDFIELNLLNKQ